jgi:ubiquitin-conjugating enzyme E2 G1
MASPSQASLLLQKQLKDLCKHPVDGFSAGLVDETNLFEWSVTIMGPQDTLYEGGFFNAIMTFPFNYPNSPPTVKFTSEIWHPNVYPDGKVCISILHPPGEDPNGYELASERWTPVHTVESIVLSIISMLSSPNDESPANVEAAVSVDVIFFNSLDNCFMNISPPSPTLPLPCTSFFCYITFCLLYIFMAGTGSMNTRPNMVTSLPVPHY